MVTESTVEALIPLALQQRTYNGSTRVCPCVSVAVFVPVDAKAMLNVSVKICVTAHPQSADGVMTVTTAVMGITADVPTIFVAPAE